MYSNRKYQRKESPILSDISNPNLWYKVDTVNPDTNTPICYYYNPYKNISTWQDPRPELTSSSDINDIYIVDYNSVSNAADNSNIKRGRKKKISNINNNIEINTLSDIPTNIEPQLSEYTSKHDVTNIVKAGNISALKNFIANNNISSLLEELLITSINYCQVEIFEYLLLLYSNEANDKTKNTDYTDNTSNNISSPFLFSCLITALRANSYLIPEILLERFSNYILIPDLLYNDKYTILDICVYNGNKHTLKLILSYFDSISSIIYTNNLNFRTIINHIYSSALNKAIVNNETEILEILLPYIINNFCNDLKAVCELINSDSIGIANKYYYIETLEILNKYLKIKNCIK